MAEPHAIGASNFSARRLLGEAHTKSIKSTTSPDADFSPRDQLHRIFADALDVNSLDHESLLDTWPSINLMEAVVLSEQAGGLPEVNEDAILRCKTISDLMDLLISATEPDTVTT